MFLFVAYNCNATRWIGKVCSAGERAYDWRSLLFNNWMIWHFRVWICRFWVPGLWNRILIGCYQRFVERRRQGERLLSSGLWFRGNCKVLQQRECASVLGSCSNLVSSAVSVGTLSFGVLWGGGGYVRTDIRGFDLDVCGYFLAVLQCLYISILRSNHFRNFVVH